MKRMSSIAGAMLRIFVIAIVAAPVALTLPVGPAPGAGELKFTVQSTGSADSGWTGASFDIDLRFMCCEEGWEMCSAIEITITVATGNSPRTIAANLAASIEEAFAEAECDPGDIKTGDRQVQVYGIPPTANSDCTTDSPCKFEDNDGGGASKPHIIMEGASF